MTDPWPSLDEQIQCVEREIKMRQWYYPSWVAKGKKADHELAAMKAVLATLLMVKGNQRPT